MRPAIIVRDDVLNEQELLRWQALVRTGQQSTCIEPESFEGTELWRLARETSEGLPLIHALAFEIRAGHETELHRDVGEYAVLFYPFDNDSAPLRVSRDGVESSVDVKANRLVVLDCTSVAHQQIVPEDGSARHSVAFKFRLPEEEV